ncbi:MAG: hypothetical protein BWY78_01447 [Alphaproteobacteria bacterium ADurb.Bin438]|nr:MAG: hypothetical protein BWY78_01447 [Alphaproteobacteria bacterium ADurb.Bin438]
MNIRMNDLNGAENVFMKALKNYNEKSFWSNLAKDGMETVKKLKGEESYENSVAKEAEKIKNIMKDNSKQKLASAYRLKIRIQGHQNTR